MGKNRKKKLTKQEKRLKKMVRHEDIRLYEEQFSAPVHYKKPLPVQVGEFAEEISVKYGMSVNHDNDFSEKLYGMKISEALIKLSEPLHPEGEFDIDTFKSIIDVTATAWNLSCITEEDRQNCFEYVLRRSEKNADWLALSEEERNALMEELDFLIERKEELFPDINCMISSVKAIDEGDSFHVLAATELYVEPLHKKLFGGIKNLLLKLCALHEGKRRS